MTETWLPFATIERGPYDDGAHGGPVQAHDGVVEHATTNWVDPGPYFAQVINQASSHLWLRRDGLVVQYLPLEVASWAQSAGNYSYVSIETDGTVDVPLSDQQVSSFARIYTAIERLPGLGGFGFGLAETPGDKGLGWHGMGGAAWGGHFGCLPLDRTEVLTPSGWIPLADVTPETPVASWAAGRLRFACPLAIVTPYEDRTVVVAGVEMTPDHRLHVHRSDHPARKIIEARDVATARTNWLIPAQGTLPTSGAGVGADLMRLLVWVQADGHYQTKDGRFEAVEFHFVKERKVMRVREVLDRLAQPYRLSRRANGSTVIRVYGVEWLRANVVRWMPTKRWGWWLLDADADEFAALDEEIVLADGHERPDMRVYSTSVESNADVVQALYVTHGRSAAKHRHPDGWTVQMHVRRRAHALRDTFAPCREETVVGCLTTVDDTILVRQDGRVAVVGNCPGDLRKAQRPAILAMAQGQGGDMPNDTDVTDAWVPPSGHPDFGSTWQLQWNGGVETLDGIRFYGSYLSLPAPSRQGVRHFSAIGGRADGKPGYVLFGDDGSHYRMAPAAGVDAPAGHLAVEIVDHLGNRHVAHVMQP